LWNGWKSGFSSSSAVQQGEKEDGKTEADNSAAEAAAGGEEASPEAEPEQKYTYEELQGALNECVENLEAEKKKVSNKKQLKFQNGRRFYFFFPFSHLV
jgi:hypothetical protein